MFGRKGSARGAKGSGMGSARGNPQGTARLFPLELAVGYLVDHLNRTERPAGRPANRSSGTPSEVPPRPLARHIRTAKPSDPPETRPKAPRSYPWFAGATADPDGAILMEVIGTDGVRACDRWISLHGYQWCGHPIKVCSDCAGSPGVA